jgi:hypothetical protein
VGNLIAIINLRILSFEDRVGVSLAPSLKKMLKNILSPKEFLEDFFRISYEFIAAYKVSVLQ